MYIYWDVKSVCKTSDVEIKILILAIDRIKSANESEGVENTSMIFDYCLRRYS